MYLFAALALYYTFRYAIKTTVISLKYKKQRFTMFQEQANLLKHSPARGLSPTVNAQLHINLCVAKASTTTLSQEEFTAQCCENKMTQHWQMLPRILYAEELHLTEQLGVFLCTTLPPILELHA